MFNEQELVEKAQNKYLTENSEIKRIIVQNC